MRVAKYLRKEIILGKGWMENEVEIDRAQRFRIYIFPLIDEKLGYQVYLKYSYICITLFAGFKIIIKYCWRYEISLKIGRI